MQSGASAADSPCSSRASVAGSSCSEPWSAAAGTQQDDELGGGVGSACAVAAGPSSMVLRKRVRKMGRDVKRHGDQLVEVKGELKACKAKLDTQTKQVRMEERYIAERTP